MPFDNWHKREAVRSSMSAMAENLKRDPQLESILENRRHALGIDVTMSRGAGIAQDLMAQLGLGRGRGLGL